LYVAHTVLIFTLYIFNKKKMCLLKYNKTEKTHFKSSANSYTFRHQGAIIREFFSNKGS
jgi:hypothetical protein